MDMQFGTGLVDNDKMEEKQKKNAFNEIVIRDKMSTFAIIC